MKRKYYTLEDAPDHITLNSQGAIVVESISVFDGELDLLLLCVEDHITNNFYEGECGEHIDWSMVFDDYQAALDMKEERDAKESKS